MYKLGKIIKVIFVVTLLFMLLFNPQHIIYAAESGLNLWLFKLIPSLFPFMVLIGLLNAMGAPRIVGYLLRPIMKPLFNVSGSGGYAYIMGILSGYPAGAKIVGDLYEDGEISTIEAQRLMSFCNSPGPLFVLGSVCTSMLGVPSLGFFLLFIMVLSSLTNGLLFRFYKANSTDKPHYEKRSSVTQNPSLGGIISSAMLTMLQVGGCVIFFAVVIKSIELLGLFDVLIMASKSFTSLNSSILKALFCGMIEFTQGILSLSKSYPGNEGVIVPLIAFLLAFGGLSVHIQTLSLSARAGINTGIYFLSKLTHAAIAFTYANLFYPTFATSLADTAMVFNPTENMSNQILESALLCAIIFVVFTILKFAYITKTRRKV